MPVRTALRPGELSPTLPVPASIARPEYVEADRARGQRAVGADAETIERMRVAGRIAAQALAEARRGRRARASPPTSSTGSATSSSATTAPTRRRSATTASRSRCAPSVNEVICHGIPDSHACSRTATSSTSTSPPSSTACTATPTPPSSSATSTRSTRLLVERTHEALMRGDQGGQARAARSTSSAGSSSPTPSGSATAWSATSPATASARRSTPAWSSRTTTSPRVDDGASSRA